jgi:hypothetical protein
MLLWGLVWLGRCQGGAGLVADRLLVDLGADGLVTVATWPEGGLPSRGRGWWPLDEGALEDLRWYLEDYLRAPFGVWEEAARKSKRSWPDGGRRCSRRYSGPGLRGMPTSGRGMGSWSWCSGPRRRGCWGCRGS